MRNVTIKLLLLLSVLLNWSCAGNPVSPRQSNKPTTPWLAAAVHGTVTSARAGLGRLGTLIANIKPETLPEDKATAKEMVANIDTQLGDAETQAKSTEKSASDDAATITKVEKENTALKQHNPFRTFLWWLSIAGGAGFVGFLAFAIFFAPPLTKSHWVWGACFSLVIGAGAATLAYFLIEVMLAILVIAGIILVGSLAWAIVYAIRNRKFAIDSINTIDAGRAAGQIIFTPEAKDPVKSVAKAYQSPLTKAFVDSVQAKMKPTFAGGV